MRKIKDLSGVKFGKLTVIELYGFQIKKSGERMVLWLCKCDCGNEKVVSREGLTSGKTKSCGCLRPKKVEKHEKRKLPHNTYNLTGEYGIGYTIKGEEFYFDLEDYEKIKDYYWMFNKRGYLYSVKNKKKIIFHRYILGITDSLIDVDHIYHKKFDNRKSELRIVNRSQNSMNRSLRSDNKSGVTGVCWNKFCDKWIAYICVNKKRINLGRFDDYNQAVKIRKEAEKKYFGEFRYREN